jgi:hypothetical protein
MKSHCRVQVSGKIIKDLFGFLHCVLGVVCLLACYCAEGHHHCQVDGLRIIQDASYYLLDMFYVGIQEGGG